MNKAFIWIILSAVSFVFAQTEQAYQSDEKAEGSSFFDPSRLKVNHATSFAMSTGGAMGPNSESLYSTMLEYNFVAPVTVRLNFSLPIHSTYSSSMNFTSQNLTSTEYFQSIPFDAQVLWQPRENVSVLFSFSRSQYNGAAGTYPYMPQRGFSPFYGSW